VEHVSRSLKLAAKQLGCPVLALAQLNREAEGRPDGRPRLSDLREAGGIEQDADAVMLLWRRPDPDMTEDAPTVPVSVLVEKQRNGPTGQADLIYRRACTRFEASLPSM
jgi:replicative DNA helicase